VTIKVFDCDSSKKNNFSNYGHHDIASPSRRRRRIQHKIGITEVQEKYV
jgi:hypothetical protein